MDNSTKYDGGYCPVGYQGTLDGVPPGAFPVRMYDGSIGYHDNGKALNKDWWYRKEDAVFFCTHTKSGRLLTSAKTLKSLKALLAEPEFFDETPSVARLQQAYLRWARRSNWNV